MIVQYRRQDLLKFLGCTGCLAVLVFPTAILLLPLAFLLPKKKYNVCLECGYEEEIFSNETKVKCSQCGNWIYKEKLPSCIDWCAAARQCLGEERWKALMGDK